MINNNMNMLNNNNIYVKHLNGLLGDLKKEEGFIKKRLNLTVNENILSNTARNFLSSRYSDKYYFGGGTHGVVDFGNFTFVGLPAVEAIYNEATIYLKKVLGASVVNINCLSGIHAMMCAILTLSDPGDLVMSVNPENGGHFATRGIIVGMGRRHSYCAGVSGGPVNIAGMAEVAVREKARLIYVDLSTYIEPFNVRELRKLTERNTRIVFDASHSLGLNMANIFQNPIKEGADAICANTHKTLFGPHKGLIAFADKNLGNKADNFIKSYLYSTIHLNQLISLCIAIIEHKLFGLEYARQVVKNSYALSGELKKLGFFLRESSAGHFSQNEQVHVFIDDQLDYVGVYKRLLDNSIATNFLNCLGGRWFARVGTQEITRMGMKEGEMAIIANIIHRSVKGLDAKNEVKKLLKRFPSVEYSLDNYV